MAIQQQNSSFAKRLGARVAQANAEHAAKPVDTGNMRLPAGIKNGIAKLSSMYTKEYEDDGSGKNPLAGEIFFRASAVVESPEVHNGERIKGRLTSIIIPLCDVPAKGQKQAKSFSDNWYEFQNLFKLLGVAPCHETPATDPTGAKTEAYFMAAMKALTDPERLKNNPIYISFSTRGWTPPASAQKPNPEEMVFESWHGLAEAPTTKFNPGGGFTESESSTGYNQPPGNEADGLPPGPPTQTETQTQPDPDDGPDRYDEVQSLVETAMADPKGDTPDGIEAAGRLEEMAWENGWTKEQTAAAADWAEVGNMALSKPIGTTPSSLKETVPMVGARFMFCKRGRDGSKLKNKEDQEFPPLEIEVTSVNTEAKTCTVKTVKDNKDVVDVRSKKPSVIKWEWLEQKR